MVVLVQFYFVLYIIIILPLTHERIFLDGF